MTDPPLQWHDHQVKCSKATLTLASITAFVTLLMAGCSRTTGGDGDGVDESGATGGAGEAGESGSSGASGETGGAEVIPCEARSMADCFGMEDPDDEYGDSCVWQELIPLTDAGNSCSMGAPEGFCLPIAPVLDGCGGAPEVECMAGGTIEYGKVAVAEIDGTLYILNFAYDCWPPRPLETCEGIGTDPTGCECACDVILGG